MSPDTRFDPATVTPGTLDLRVLDQDQVWVNRAGHVVSVHSMSDDRIHGLISFLHRHADRLHHAAMSDALADLLSDFDIGILDVGAVTAFLGVPSDPHNWLDGTCLMRRLTCLPTGHRETCS